MAKPVCDDDGGADGDGDGAAESNVPAVGAGPGAGDAEAAGSAGGRNGADEPAVVDFVDAHWELQKFMHKNGGSLRVPLSHPTLGRIVDTLSESTPGGFEALCKKRWDDRLEALGRYKEKSGGVDVPRKHPTLGNWARIQREQLERFERGDPSALSRKRHRKLRDMGFGGGGGETPEERADDGGENDAKASQHENGKGKREEAVRPNDEHGKGALPDAKKTKEVKPSESKERKKADDLKEASLQHENGKVKRREAASQNDEDNECTIPDANKTKKVKSNKLKERTKASLKSDDKSLQNENERVKHEPKHEETDEEIDDTWNCSNERDTTTVESKAKAAKPKNKNSEEDERCTSPTPTDKINKTKAKAVKPKIENSEEDERSASPSPNDKVDGRERDDHSTKLKGKCDICEKGDGFWGHNLQQCRTCGLLVHELCYGLAETDAKDPHFECHACRAVGTSVEVNIPSRIGGCGKKMGQKREWVTQDRRPRECLLCNHDRGIHAIHPLLDTHGPEGRQLCVETSVWRDGRERKERRLAWVHTLCASVINSNPGTSGSVYGCDRDRNYYDAGEGSEDSNDEEEFADDDDSGGSVEEGEEGAKEAANGREREGDSEREDSRAKEDTTTCYYAISNEGIWKQNIKEHRNLKCFQCGKIDKKWMIPVQCTAGDDHELDRWKSRHKKGTECFVGMHVGCARWGGIAPEGSHLEAIDGKRCRLCFFTPGRYGAEEDDDADVSRDSYEREKMQTIVSCYCKAHARDIVLNNPNRKAKAKIDREVRSTCPPVDKTKQLPRRNPAKAPSRVSRACPPQKLSEHAQSSLKKSLSSIREKRGSIKKGALKGRADATNLSKAKFGAPISKRTTKISFGENVVQFPSRGRSAGALAHGLGPMSASASSSASNHNNAPPASILKKRDSRAPHRDNDGTPPATVVSSKKRRASTAPDPPASGCKRIKTEPASNRNNTPTASISKRRDWQAPDRDNDGTPPASVSPKKRRTSTTPNLPARGSFKRIKTEE